LVACLAFLVSQPLHVDFLVKMLMPMAKVNFALQYWQISW
jgi:hypothetical protein